jgi:hypothetical protein
VRAGDSGSVGVARSVACNDATFEPSWREATIALRCVACHRLFGTGRSFVTHVPGCTGRSARHKGDTSRGGITCFTAIKKDGSALSTRSIAASLTRLTYAAAPAFVARGAGTIINIASVVGIASTGCARASGSGRKLAAARAKIEAPPRNARWRASHRGTGV